MASVIKLVQGDTLPTITVDLYDESTDQFGNVVQTPIDLSDTTDIRMFYRAAGATALTATIPGSVLSAATGKVSFSWPAGSLNGPEGNYEGEIQLTQYSGGIFTVYEVMKFKVRKQFA